MTKKTSAPAPTGTEKWLLDLYGPYLSTEALAKIFCYTNAHAVVEAVGEGNFPIKTFRLGRRRVADVRDVAAYLDQQKAA